MQTLLLLSSILFIAPCGSAQDAVSDIIKHLFPAYQSKILKSTKATLEELGIGDLATDSSRIINITDSNWITYLGPQSTGEWLVQFTARQEYCTTCELIDFALNVLSSQVCR